MDLAIAALKSKKFECNYLHKYYSTCIFSLIWASQNITVPFEANFRSEAFKVLYLLSELHAENYLIKGAPPKSKPIAYQFKPT